MTMDRGMRGFLEGSLTSKSVVGEKVQHNSTCTYLPGGEDGSLRVQNRGFAYFLPEKEGRDCCPHSFLKSPTGSTTPSMLATLQSGAGMSLH